MLLLILILQNQNDVRVHYLGLAGSISLGMALLSAAVAGAAVVTIVGLIRLTQVRFSSRRRLHSKVECEGQPWTHVGRDADENCPAQFGGAFSCAPVCRGLSGCRSRSRPDGFKHGPENLTAVRGWQGPERAGVSGDRGEPPPTQVKAGAGLT